MHVLTKKRCKYLIFSLCIHNIFGFKTNFIKMPVSKWYYFLIIIVLVTEKKFCFNKYFILDEKKNLEYNFLFSSTYCVASEVLYMRCIAIGSTNCSLFLVDNQLLWSHCVDFALTFFNGLTRIDKNISDWSQECTNQKKNCKQLKVMEKNHIFE